MDALDDIKSKGRQGKAVINMSFVYELNNKLPDRFFRLFRELDRSSIPSIAALTHCFLLKGTSYRSLTRRTSS